MIRTPNPTPTWEKRKLRCRMWPLLSSGKAVSISSCALSEKAVEEKQLEGDRLIVACQLTRDPSKVIPTHTFIDEAFARHHNISLIPLKKPRTLEVIDWSVVESRISPVPSYRSAITWKKPTSSRNSGTARSCSASRGGGTMASQSGTLRTKSLSTPNGAAGTTTHTAGPHGSKVWTSSPSVPVRTRWRP